MRIVLTLLFCWYFLLAEAAAPLTYLVLAEKFLTHCSADESQKTAFLLGTLFPNIGSIATIPTENPHGKQTHQKGIDLKRVLMSPSPFVAGMRLHALIDEIRENLQIKWKISSWIAEFEALDPSTLLTLIEDEILFDELNTDMFSSFLDVIAEEELMGGLPSETIKNWHAFVKSYTANKPSKTLVELSQKGSTLLRMTPTVLRSWGQLLPWFSAQEPLKNYVHELQMHFSFLLKSFYSKEFALPPIRPLPLVHLFETEDCFISSIKDFMGNHRILKQIKDPSLDEQFLLVLDALGCFLAKEHNIPMNRVTLIPAGMQFSAKRFPNRPASLHSIAPGAASSTAAPWPGFTLHQRNRKKDSPWYKKFGPLSAEETGLTKLVIEQMSMHKDLPLIAALDTFTGNADRSDPNIFYDKETDSFCGIDMAAAFTTNLGKPACAQIHRLFACNLLHEKERSALSLYRDTLRCLLADYPVEKLHALLSIFAQEAGFYEGSPWYTLEVEERMQHHKKMMEENSLSCANLILILDYYLQRS